MTADQTTIEAAAWDAWRGKRHESPLSWAEAARLRDRYDRLMREGAIAAWEPFMAAVDDLRTALAQEEASDGPD